MKTTTLKEINRLIDLVDELTQVYKKIDNVGDIDIFEEKQELIKAIRKLDSKTTDIFIEYLNK